MSHSNRPLVEQLEGRQLFSASLVKLNVPPPLGSTTAVKVKHTTTRAPKVTVHKLSTKPKVAAKHKVSQSGGETHIGTIVGSLK